MERKRRNVGGRPGITVEDVRRACEALQQQGRSIGPVNVRLELGRGSYSTIIRALRTLGLTQAREPKP
ncbi:DNA-binding protein [Ralstonia pseudosolanacearum]